MSTFYVSNIDVPCKDCKKRGVNCHANCIKYREYLVELKAFKKNLYRNKKISELTNPTTGYTWGKNYGNK